MRVLFPCNATFAYILIHSLMSLFLLGSTAQFIRAYGVTSCKWLAFEKCQRKLMKPSVLGSLLKLKFPGCVTWGCVNSGGRLLSLCTRNVLSRS